MPLTFPGLLVPITKNGTKVVESTTHFSISDPTSSFVLEFFHSYHVKSTTLPGRIKEANLKEVVCLSNIRDFDDAFHGSPWFC